jgi:hypothetical protein
VLELVPLALPVLELVPLALPVLELVPLALPVPELRARPVAGRTDPAIRPYSGTDFL